MSTKIDILSENKNNNERSTEETHFISREKLHYYMRKIGNVLAKLKQEKFLFILPLQIGVYLLMIIEAIFSVYIVVHAYKYPYSSMDLLTAFGFHKDDTHANIFIRIFMAIFYALDHVIVISLLAYEIIKNKKHVYIFIFGLNAGLILLDLYVSCMEDIMGSFPRDFFLRTAKDYIIFHIIIIFLYYLVIITFSYYYKVRTSTLRDAWRGVFNEIREKKDESSFIVRCIDKVEYYF